MSNGFMLCDCRRTRAEYRTQTCEFNDMLVNLIPVRVVSNISRVKVGSGI